MPTIRLPNPDDIVEEAAALPPIGELWFEDSVHSPRSIEPPVSDRDFLKRCLFNHRSWLDGLENLEFFVEFKVNVIIPIFKPPLNFQTYVYLNSLN